MKEIRIDCMYEICPIPLLKAIKELNRIDVGDKVIIETDHSCSITNILDWAKKNGHMAHYDEMCEGEWEISIIKD